MTTESIIRQLDDLGVSIQSMGGTLMLEPASRVPKELMNEIKQYKDDLLDVLPKDAELDDIVRHVREDGYVLLWSNVLEDSVAFIHDDFDPVRLPHGFVPYTLSELSKLFADGSLSADSLRLIHVAKKHGGKVTDVS
jgi:hypothetical protein|tara:strand:- start:475 stop:885 length:411 start_codon:yes stop_codon:yes gene_type:complete